MKFRIAAIAAVLLMGGAASAQTLPPLADAIKPTGLNAFAINVVDIEKERAFYETVFGLKVAARIPATGNLTEYLMSFTGQRADRPLLVLYKVPGPRPAGQDNFGRIVFGTPDAGALARRAVAAGGKAPNPIRDGATNMISDPEGNRIELYQPAPAAAAAPAPKAK